MLVVAHSKCKKKTHSSLAVRAVLEYVAAVGGLEHEQLNYNHTQRPATSPAPCIATVIFVCQRNTHLDLAILLDLLP